MLDFILRPNFSKLSKYCKFNETPHELSALTEKFAKEGYLLNMDYYDTEDKVKEVEKNFKAVLENYNLIDHYDNLLFLSLNQLQVNENIRYQLDLDFQNKKRIREAAQLLLAFSSVRDNDYTYISIKTKKGTTTVKDPVLTRWIGENLEKAIKNGADPLKVFGVSFGREFNKPIAHLTTDDLQTIVKEPLINPNKNFNRYNAALCFQLLPYLYGETNLNEEKSALFTDNLLRFLYDILVSFGELTPSQDVLRKEIINAFLRTRLKLK